MKVVRLDLFQPGTFSLDFGRRPYSGGHFVCGASRPRAPAFLSCDLLALISLRGFDDDFAALCTFVLLLGTKHLFMNLLSAGAKKVLSNRARESISRT
jgi:hypothetical protein